MGRHIVLSDCLFQALQIFLCAPCGLNYSHPNGIWQIKTVLCFAFSSAILYRHLGPHHENQYKRNRKNLLDLEIRRTFTKTFFLN